jgi:hypothetical protein
VTDARSFEFTSNFIESTVDIEFSLQRLKYY